MKHSQMKNYLFLILFFGLSFMFVVNAQSHKFKTYGTVNHSILGDFGDLHAVSYQTGVTYQIDKYTEALLGIGLLRDKQAYHPYDMQKLPHHIYLVPMDVSLLIVPIRIKGFSVHLGGGFSLRHRNSEQVLETYQAFPGGEPDPIQILKKDEYIGWDKGYNIITRLQYQVFNHWSVTAQMYLQSYDKGTGVASFGGGIGYHF
jgi:hypothetical protein